MKVKRKIFLITLDNKCIDIEEMKQISSINVDNTSGAIAMLHCLFMDEWNENWREYIKRRERNISKSDEKTQFLFFAK